MKSQVVEAMKLIEKAMRKELEGIALKLSEVHDQQEKAKIIAEKADFESTSQFAYANSISPQSQAILVSAAYQILSAIASTENKNSAARMLAITFVNGFLEEMAEIAPDVSVSERLHFISAAITHPLISNTEMDEDIAFMSLECPPEV